MATLVLHLLGGFEASLNSGSPVTLTTKTGQAMLAYLALTPERRHSRDKLAALLWEDRPDQQARTSLRQTLAVLRKAIPPTSNPWLRTDRDWIAWTASGYYACSPGGERLIGWQVNQFDLISPI